MQFDINDRTCGQRKPGSSIVTTHPPIVRIWFKLSCPETTSICFVKLAISQHGSFSFVTAPQIKITGEGDQYMARWHVERDGLTELYSQRELLEVFPATVAQLEEVCENPVRVIWRELGLQASNSVIIFFSTKGWILYEYDKTKKICFVIFYQMTFTTLVSL